VHRDGWVDWARSRLLQHCWLRCGLPQQAHQPVSARHVCWQGRRCLLLQRLPSACLLRWLPSSCEHRRRCALLLLLCSCEHRRRCALLLLLLLLGREGGPDCGRLLWRFLFVLAELPIHLLAGGQQPATACVSRSTRGSTCGSSHK
jgi:hypothetical protein